MKILVILAALISGCAFTGITMSADEARACKESGCSVWTEAELRTLMQKVFREAYMQGRKAAI